MGKGRFSGNDAVTIRYLFIHKTMALETYTANHTPKIISRILKT
jgi:hypothetical protein